MTLIHKFKITTWERGGGRKHTKKIEARQEDGMRYETTIHRLRLDRVKVDVSIEFDADGDFVGVGIAESRLS